MSLAVLIGMGAAGSVPLGYGFATFQELMFYLGDPNRVRKELTDRRGLSDHSRDCVRRGLLDLTLPQPPSYGRQIKEIIKMHWGKSTCVNDYPGETLEEKYSNLTKAFA